MRISDYVRIRRSALRCPPGPVPGRRGACPRCTGQPRPAPPCPAYRSRELVHRIQGFFHLRNGFHIGTDAIAVGQNRPHLFRLQPGGQQRGFGMLQMLLRVFFIIIIVQIADGHPMLRIPAKMPGHGPHGGRHTERVMHQAFLLHHGGVQLLGPFQCQHTDSLFSSFDCLPVYYILEGFSSKGICDTIKIQTC